MRQLALHAIGAYKRYLSPYKGFCCAYRVHTGRASCSTLGFRAIRRHGVFQGLVLLRARFARCTQACQRGHGGATGLDRMQRGLCDLGGCDVPCDGDCSGCDCAGCGGPGRTKQRKA